MISSLDEEPYAQLWQHWEAIRGDQKLPDYNDVELTTLASILPEVSLLDIVTPDQMLYRLVGSQVVERFGNELTGVNLLDIFDPKCRAPLAQGLMAVAAKPCGGFCRTSVTYRSGGTFTSKLLCLPLQPTDDLLGKALLVQNPNTGALLNDPVTAIGADFFETQMMDIGYGKADDIDVRFKDL